MRRSRRRFGDWLVRGALATVGVVAFAAPRASATEPPDSTEPDGVVALDDERQAIFDEMISLGRMLRRPLNPACLSGLLAEFPNGELWILASAVESRIEVEQLEITPGPLSGYPAPLSAEVADFAYESIRCIRGDADVDLLDAAVARVADDSEDGEIDTACVKAILSTWPDELLLATVEGRQLNRDQVQGLSEDQLRAAMEDVVLIQLCAPGGRERVGDIMGTPISTIPPDGVISRIV